MKKLILPALVIAGLGVVTFDQAKAADGTITFNGNISAITCSINGNGLGANTPNFPVTIPTVSTSAFNGKGSYAGGQYYQITVGGNSDCQNGSMVSIHYEPASPRVDLATGYLMLDPDPGAATGVELQILNGDKTPIKLGSTATDSNQVMVQNNTAVLPFFVQYIATAATVTDGPANSSVLYSVRFN